MQSDEFLSLPKKSSLTPELAERLEFEMSLPHSVLADPERAKKLWEQFVQARRAIGPAAAALAIRLVPDVDG